MATATPQARAAAKVTTTPIPAHLLPVVPTRQDSFTTPDGHTTEILAQAFQDRILILITQVGKVGCLIQSQTPTSLFQSSSHLDDPSDADADADTAPTLPPPSSSTTLSHLFGTPPHGYATLYDLYVSQVAAIVAADLAKSYQDSAGQRPVVVGLGLKVLPRQSGTDGGDDDDDGGDEMAVMLGEAERKRFLEIMMRVAGCRVW
ncbi:uncharacterized protein PFL1_01004 [Pseudozyma flocculosa PF-1]|uniref:Proteasome assembly chaperone 3 n=1 Tax=Pseudozyma flocculosa TaxID=84751 RepID=A0A5C3F8M4_9BASI|nr:uncharacterized protein PFL1_01004 [Pseudozyma flocculosa PF-1]EPQ31671.1 hypothetical protein PFL1_01004 [Pseudozyma flocculosa PF-1]SPO40788.1 uncharacterized protein PSFLO_06270 [Pseudozyma flocculosa]